MLDEGGVKDSERQAQRSVPQPAAARGRPESRRDGGAASSPQRLQQQRCRWGTGTPKAPS